MKKYIRYLTLSLAPFVFTPAFAQEDYPTQPIQLVVPFSPGGSIDIVARTLAPELTDILGQPVVVENRTGASGYVGGEFVANADPDGYTIVMHGLPLATQPHLRASLPIDPLTDLKPITVVAYQPNMLVVHSGLEVETVQELVEYAKAHPGEINFASSGQGATQHLAGEMLKEMADIDIVHVPYQGGGSAMPDLLSGRVQMMIETAPGAMQYVQSGQLRALGVTSTERLDVLPDVPTIDEAGVEGYELAGWLLLLAPADTPDEIVTELHEATVAALNEPEVKQRLQELGLQVGGASPEQTAEFLKSETDRYGELIRSVGITPN